MNNAQREMLVKRLADHEQMDKAISEAVQQALRHHKEIGNSIAVWRDGRVVIVPAEEIVLSADIQRKTEIPLNEPALNSGR